MEQLCVNDGCKIKSVSGHSCSNVGGVFVVLICGLMLSLVVVIIEFVWKAQKDSAIDKVCDVIIAIVVVSIVFVDHVVVLVISVTVITIAVMSE